MRHSHLHTHTYIYVYTHAHTNRQDFATNNLTSLITVSHRNIITKGFPSLFEHPVTNTQSHTHIHTHTHTHKHKLVHAAALDVPNPWDAIRYVAEILCVNGMVSSFSPCIEQVYTYTPSPPICIYVYVHTLNTRKCAHMQL